LPRQLFTDEVQCAAVLAAAEVGVLAMAGADGAPYAIPVNFLYADGRIYIHCALKGHKLELLAADARVCFTAWVVDELVVGPQPCDSTTHYRSVLAWGAARELTDPDRKRDVLAALTARYAGAELPPAPEHRVAHLRILELVIDRLSGKRSWSCT
jgi:nitroimidazol reductase NimA-like FMN-containing flavoprotein (pyridoxamine 5'-phosphate oxidase superfamily)